LNIRLAKVTDFDVPVFIHKNIEWLQVSMDDTFLMHVEDTFSDFIHHVLDVVSVHGLRVVPDDVHQVLGAVLGHKVQVIEGLWITWSHNCLKFNNL
jgi:hypothetical protein